ncbi:MAG: endolytic transglycosylase MltG [Candidatus Eisenbacteria bacterium]
MKKLVYLVLLPLFTLFLLGLGLGAHRFFHGPPPPGAAEVLFSIPEGTGFGEVCRILRREGVVKNTNGLYLVGRVGGAERQIRAGRYRIVSGTPAGRVLRMLQRGGNEVIRVTVPEGLRVDETARIVAANLAFEEEAFLAAARDPEAAEKYGIPGPTLEGYLFPETYRFFWDDPVESVLRRMTGRFRDEFDEEARARAAGLGLTPREAVTLASIIEAEAAVGEERPRISAVFHNRLRIGMKLQADPTVQFARGTRERLLRKHLELESPYNTYVVGGLPPGPICSPGRASIRAALEPLPGSRDLYFVASGEGGRHIFSSSREAHDLAKSRASARRESP